ncbi:uncharacterized protein P174DRAFT_501625 [Aspergillus novofumigatus IBT 16806]|uniref:Uncharacterized protein n=1 Tax=Aspergillus novofumigatus (strain IBT 16806) TaxID=1392255 RepID=A0A2I1CH59_ASPN1|nr:uncharacterized protein P174DRAFT_501625 [Aspergillus novofumigatus IBT 16806]PKX96959.1 hypothetical protein P174DRAFT_501625 [Aspergillus novofumigatus IBT 16806]
MTEKKTTRTLKSDIASNSKRLCNVKEPKPQAKKEPEVPSKRTSSNPGPTVLKKAKPPVKEQSPAATESNEPSLKVNDKAVGSINSSQRGDSTVPVKDSSSHQAGYRQNNWPGRCSALQLACRSVAPVAPVTPFDAGPGAQYYTLPVGHSCATRSIRYTGGKSTKCTVQYPVGKPLPRIILQRHGVDGHTKLPVGLVAQEHG